MEGDVITLQDIFLFDFGMGVDEHGRFKGHLKATGVRPKFAEKLADLGIRLGQEVFQPEGFTPQGGRRPVSTVGPACVCGVGAVRPARWCWPSRPPRWPPTPTRPPSSRSAPSTRSNAATPTIGYFDTGSRAGRAADDRRQRRRRSRPARPTPLPPSTPRGIAVVLDTSTAAETSGALVAAKAALDQLDPGPHRRPGHRRAVRHLRGQRHRRAGPGLHQRHGQAGGGHRPGGAARPPKRPASKTALWSAVRQAAGRPQRQQQPRARAGHHGRPGRQRQRRPAEGGHRRGRQRQHPGVQPRPTPAAATTPSSLKSLSYVLRRRGRSTTDQGPPVGDLVTRTQSTVDTSQYTVTYASTAKANQVVNLTLAASGQTSSVVLHGRHLDGRATTT